MASLRISFYFVVIYVIDKVDVSHVDTPSNFFFLSKLA